METKDIINELWEKIKVAKMEVIDWKYKYNILKIEMDYLKSDLRCLRAIGDKDAKNE